jgi:predicted thioesterase
MSDLAPGLKAQLSLVVGPENTAAAMGSGNANVFATPEMVRLMEGAAVEALRGHLAPGTTSVGIELQVRHLAATPVGMQVTVEAELTEVNGRILTFKVLARDSVETVGDGIHKRAIIDIARFMQKVEAKKATDPQKT